MAVEEAHTEETPYGGDVTSEGWFVHNLQEALAVRFQRGGALYPLEPREAPFRDIGVNVRVLWPGDANGLYHHEDAQEDSSCSSASAYSSSRSRSGRFASGTTSIVRPAPATSSSVRAKGHASCS